MWTMFGAPEPVEIMSILSPSQCTDRLRNSIDKSWYLIGFRPVLGWVGSDRMGIRKRIWYGNSHQTYLTAELAPQGTGTRFICRTSLHPFVKVFGTIGLSLFLLFEAGVLTAAIWGLAVGKQSSGSMAFLALLVAAILLSWGFVYGVARFGLWLARDEREFLLGFVRKTVNPVAD